MGQVKVDALDRRILGHDHVKALPGPSGNVNQRTEPLESVVYLENPLHDYDGDGHHGPVEDGVEFRVDVHVLEYRHPVNFLELAASFEDSILEMEPVNTLI